ncbi:MAG: hypothetical protein HY423_11715 [Candidatus Lambdaproteobacteria bacterium]|nr:hypothetical protein [Candidatus Lambdaproteobacteria bacterium]
MTTTAASHLSDPSDPAALIETYYERGWTDGLPVVPPSRGAIEAMLAAGGLRASDLLGVIDTRNQRILADKVAINAVMAGCKPEYMPVVVAAIKGLSHPDFHYHGPATSTGGSNIVVIVNGPIAQRIGVNAKDNAFGPGFRANATIGRAVRLVMMNVLNTRPGGLDRSALGTPGKYSFCFAENEAESPWEPFHVERGFKREQSTVTIYAAEGVIQVSNGISNRPEPLLQGMADAMANLGSRNITGQGDYVVVFAGEHSALLGKSGWSKKQVKQYLYDHARRTLADLKRVERLPGPSEPGDENRWLHATESWETVLVFCAGGAVGTKSACLPAWGSPKSGRTVTTLVVEP